MQSTDSIRSALPGLVQELGSRTLLDAPCGDYLWMKCVNLQIDRYIGADIVPALVEQLREKYGDDRHDFMVLNIVEDPLPDADLFFYRDCMLHLTFDSILKVIENFKRSSCSYLIASTYRRSSRNRDIVNGESRTIDLCKPPFNLPEPMRLIDDQDTRAHDKSMGVWSREQLIAGDG